MKSILRVSVFLICTVNFNSLKHLQLSSHFLLNCLSFYLFWREISHWLILNRYFFKEIGLQNVTDFPPPKIISSQLAKSKHVFLHFSTHALFSATFPRDINPCGIGMAEMRSCFSWQEQIMLFCWKDLAVHKLTISFCAVVYVLKFFGTLNWSYYLQLNFQQNVWYQTLE